MAEAINIPILITKKETYYTMPYTPWYKKPGWVIFALMVIFLTYIGTMLYSHWTDPTWCSPWLRKEICDQERIQSQLENGVYPKRTQTETPTTSPDEQPNEDY